MTETDLVTTAIVARRVNRSVATINRWVSEGRLVPSLTLPGKTGAHLFDAADVDALTDERDA